MLYKIITNFTKCNFNRTTIFIVDFKYLMRFSRAIEFIVTIAKTFTRNTSKLNVKTVTILVLTQLKNKLLKKLFILPSRSRKTSTFDQSRDVLKK